MYLEGSAKDAELDEGHEKVELEEVKIMKKGKKDDDS